MRIYKDNIPASHLPKVVRVQKTIPVVFFNRVTSGFYTKKIAQIVPAQSLNDTVKIYEQALPYIRCELQSTIQHEAAHRKDEEQRNQDMQHGTKVMDFDAFTSESRVESIAERAEENCGGLLPLDYRSGPVISVNINQLFEDAKQQSNIDPRYIQDIRAGSLDEQVAGMHVMHDTPSLMVADQISEDMWRAVDGTLWVDVYKRVSPFIAEEDALQQQKPTFPATYQSDGVEYDYPGVANRAPAQNAVPAVPFRSAVPSVETR